MKYVGIAEGGGYGDIGTSIVTYSNISATGSPVAALGNLIFRRVEIVGAMSVIR